MTRSRLLAFGVAAALAAVPATATAHHDTAPHPKDTAPGTVQCVDADNGSLDFVTPVDGSAEDAYGIFAAPESAPTVLVVAAHGAWHSAESWRRHIEYLTGSYDTLTVAMEYRGLERVPGGHLGNDPAHPEAAGWPQKAGGEDLIAAAKRFQAACPSIDTTIVLGVSMGAAMSGYALSHLPAGDEGLFDYWVAVEGAHNMLETYHEAKAAGSTAADWMEAETGGTPTEVPNEYEERTNVLKTAAIDASGLSRVVLMHAVWDGVVPYHHSRMMAAQLNLPIEFHTVTSPGAGSDGSTISDLLYPGEGPLAGHATERDPNSLLMRAAFERVGVLASGNLSDCGEYHVNEGVFPDVEFQSLATYPCGDPLTGEPPKAHGDSASTTDIEPVVIDVLANDTDPESEPLTVVGFSQPASGVVTDNGDGTVRYAPEQGVAGSFSFEYTITDPAGNTDSANVVVTVTIDPDSPAACEERHTNQNGKGHTQHGNGKGKGHCKSHHDDHDHDDDGIRDDLDTDDDGDGRHDGTDDDDDNDGIADGDDSDDDNDGIDDRFDTGSNEEFATSGAHETAAGDTEQTRVDIPAGTPLFAVVAEGPGADQLVIQIVDPLGNVVSVSAGVAGRTLATIVPSAAGTYVVRVINPGAQSLAYELTMISRTV